MKFNLITRFTFVMLLFAVSLSSLHAQTRKPTKLPPLTKDQAAEMKKQASAFFKDGRFRDAIKDYERLVAYDPNDLDFNYNLGVSYVLSNVDKTKGVEFLAKAADIKDCPKDVYYYMGRSLLVSGLFDEALEAFEKYRSANNGKLNEKFYVEQYEEYCYNAKEYTKTPLDISITNLGKLVNSEYPDYGPVSMAVDTAVFFTSNRKGNAGGILDGNGEFIPDVYASYRTGNVWSKAKNMGIGVNSELYDISTGMNSNGDVLLIYKEGQASGDVYMSELNYKSWQKAVLFDESMETKTFETGACLSPDGKRLYFAADMKGGQGGKDIYFIEKDDSKKWGKPVNLGPEVNTKFDEDNPFIWHDGKTLFFASMGHNSMGGFDIFMSEQGDPSQPWSKPVNVGYPLNTYDDDLYFSLSANAKTGFISSLRKDGLGDLDIYYFKLKDQLLPNKGTLLRASIIGPTGLGAKDALCMVIKESTGEIMGVMQAVGPKTEISILLPPGQYTLQAKSKRMGRMEEKINITGTEVENGIVKVFKLEPLPGK